MLNAAVSGTNDHLPQAVQHRHRRRARLGAHRPVIKNAERPVPRRPHQVAQRPRRRARARSGSSRRKCRTPRSRSRTRASSARSMGRRSFRSARRRSSDSARSRSGRRSIAGPDGEDTIAIRTCAYFSLSFDHRIVDGADADKFLAALKKGLEGYPDAAALTDAAVRSPFNAHSSRHLTGRSSPSALQRESRALRAGELSDTGCSRKPACRAPSSSSARHPMPRRWPAPTRPHPIACWTRRASTTKWSFRKHADTHRSLSTGRSWRVFPSGRVTQYDRDEFALLFISGTGPDREVRVTRYSPHGTRSREQSLVEMSDADVARLFELFAAKRHLARSRLHARERARPAGTQAAFVDLHMHSTASDGSRSPAEVVRAAKRASLAAIALTDHDTVAGLAEAAAVGAELGIRVVTGVELSAVEGDTETHILGLHLNDTAVLERGLGELREMRGRRAARIVELLQSQGVQVTLRRRAAAGRRAARSADRTSRARWSPTAGRPTCATRSTATSARDVRPTSPRISWRCAEAIAMVHAAGGLAILAHPGAGGYARAHRTARRARARWRRGEASIALAARRRAHARAASTSSVSSPAAAPTGTAPRTGHARSA